MGKSTISMVIFNSYVKLPEGRSIHLKSERPKILRWNRVPGAIYLQLCIGFVGKIFTGFTMSGWWCWWCNNHLEKIYEFVNGKDDILYMKWKINTVWNHQPDVLFPWHMGVFRIQHVFQPIDWTKLINAENRRPYRCLNFDSHSNPSTIKPSFTQRWPILQGNWLVQQITCGKTMTFWSTERRPQYI